MQDNRKLNSSSFFLSFTNVSKQIGVFFPWHQPNQEEMTIPYSTCYRPAHIWTRTGTCFGPKHCSRHQAIRAGCQTTEKRDFLTAISLQMQHNPYIKHRRKNRITWASQSLSRSSMVRAFSLIMKRRIFSSFSTYWGWCRLSRSTIDSTLCSWIHSCTHHHTTTCQSHKHRIESCPPQNSLQRRGFQGIYFPKEIFSNLFTPIDRKSYTHTQQQ